MLGWLQKLNKRRRRHRRRHHVTLRSRYSYFIRHPSVIVSCSCKRVYLKRWSLQFPFEFASIFHCNQREREREERGERRERERLPVMTTMCHVISTKRISIAPRSFSIYEYMTPIKSTKEKKLPTNGSTPLGPRERWSSIDYLLNIARVRLG